MKFGVREICDVVFKAKSALSIGNMQFGKDEPVLYFDTLKTSSLEGSATTVYVQGGGGNSRLIAWEGERTLTFTMEDALLSPIGFAVLSGAGLIPANSTNAHLHVHQTLQKYGVTTTTGEGAQAVHTIVVDAHEEHPATPNPDTICTGYSTAIYAMVLNTVGDPLVRLGTGTWDKSTRKFTFSATAYEAWKGGQWTAGENVLVLVDYYIIKDSGATQLDISPEKFGGNYYVEASTLFRRQSDGVDMPAEFVIPNAKIQSNFSFSLSSSGDPSTFTFTLDAFPDYTKWDKSRKVLAAIQIIGSDEEVAGDSIAHQNDETTTPMDVADV